MPIDITMPALSPTMTEGSLARWLVEEGQTVAPGDVIAEIETDKATMEVEAVDEGVIGRILIPAGTDGVAVNSVIGVLLTEGEEPPRLAERGPEPPAADPAVLEPPQPAGRAPAPVVDRAVSEPPRGAEKTGERVLASPLARRMAAQAGLDLRSIAGSGPHGRIVKTDIDAVLRVPEVPAPAARHSPDDEVVRLSSMRRVIAERMTEAKTTIPHFYLSVDCDIDRLLEFRAEINRRAAPSKVSINDIVIRACAAALRRVPAANVSWAGDGSMIRHHAVDISVAVAVPGGLVTPVVRNADAKGLVEIADEMKDFAARAREGKLLPEEYQGGSMSVSNLGMYGVKQFDAVINPPQASILAVGAGEARPVVRDGALAVAQVMTCTLSIDHRVLDGAAGGELLTAIRSFLEYPPAILA